MYRAICLGCITHHRPETAVTDPENPVMPINEPWFKEGKRLLAFHDETIHWLTIDQLQMYMVSGVRNRL